MREEQAIERVELLSLSASDIMEELTKFDVRSMNTHLFCLDLQSSYYHYPSFVCGPPRQMPTAMIQMKKLN